MTSLPQHVPRLIRGISTPGEISIVGVTGAAAAAAAAAVNTNMPLIGQGSCGKACTPPTRRARLRATLAPSKFPRTLHFLRHSADTVPMNVSENNQFRRDSLSQKMFVSSRELTESPRN